MFGRQLHTTFDQVQLYLGAYITNIALAPDGRTVTASLTGDYYLRTFLILKNGTTRIVLDVMGDAQGDVADNTEAVDEANVGATDSVAQAQPELPPHPSPLPEGEGKTWAPTTEAVPGDVPPVAADPTPEIAPEIASSPSPPGRGAAQRRGGSAQALPPGPNEEQITRQNAGRPATLSLRTATETPGPNPPGLRPPLPRGGREKPGPSQLRPSPGTFPRSQRTQRPRLLLKPPLPLPLLGGVPCSGGVGLPRRCHLARTRNR